MRRTIGLVCILAAGLLLLPAPLHPQAPEGIIIAVEVRGLKKTKPHVAERPLRHFVGRRAAALDLNEVRAVILDTGILEPLSVRIEDGYWETGKILVVEVREKWSIFPVPIFFVGSGGMMAGAAFYDANAFGLNDKMVAAGMYQSDGWNTTLMYIHSPAGDGNFGLSGSFSFAQQEQKDRDQRDETIRRYQADSVTARAGLLYRFTAPLSGALRFSYTGRSLGTGGDPLLSPAEGAQVIGMGPEFSIRDSSWDGYLLSGRSAVFGYRYSQGIGSPSFHSLSFHSLSFQGIFEKSIVPGFRINSRGGLLWSPLVPVLFEESPDAAEVNILPRSFSARHYAGLSLGLEKHLFKISAGALAVLASWQMVYSHGSILGNQFDYGVSGAFFFYLSKLAIPAVGLGLSYNIPADFFQVSFSMGMSI
ncbi:MAG: hypothetical protein LBQ55_02310 [Treponema sp.]|nr:hypothetical protein [Treponema sp.]